jgi:hypothetical protein
MVVVPLVVAPRYGQASGAEGPEPVKGWLLICSGLRL